MYMPKISVICVTNRKDARQFLMNQLEKQTLQDFEVICADDYGSEPLVDTDPNWFRPRQKVDGDVYNLCKAYNDCLDRAKGELLVFLQDFIHIPANGLERFWELYEMFPNDIYTGVGHKAAKGLEGISEIDERALGEPGVSPGNYSHFELNWSAAPRAIFPHFNEEWDTFYAGGEKLIAYDLEQAGHRIWIDRSNQCIGLSQVECGGRPADWEERHFKTSNYFK